MKLKLMLLVLLFSTIVKGQNGGGLSESGSLKLESAGTFNYKAVIKVTNKQTCDINVRFDHNGQTIIKPVPGLGSDTIQVTLPECVIKAKPMTNCGNSADMGWVEINMCAALPIKFEWINARNINNCTVVKFKAGSVEDRKEITLNFTLPNNTVKRYPIKFPNYIHPGDIWEIKIDNINNTYSLKKLW